MNIYFNIHLSYIYFILYIYLINLRYFINYFHLNILINIHLIFIILFNLFDIVKFNYIYIIFVYIYLGKLIMLDFNLKINPIIYYFIDLILWFYFNVLKHILIL